MRLRAWDLSMERGGRRLFSDLSFEAEGGSALIVTGPNGAGKSSLMRGLCGFLRFEAGGFALDGGDPERTVGEEAHYLGHADALKGALTAGENLAFWAGALGGDSRREACQSALARVGLAHVVDFPASALSAGQKRRVALARLLVANRPLWLLDEPTTALELGRSGELRRDHAGVPQRRRDRGRGDPRAPRASGCADAAARRGGGGGGVRTGFAVGSASAIGVPAPHSSSTDGRPPGRPMVGAGQGEGSRSRSTARAPLQLPRLTGVANDQSTARPPSLTSPTRGEEGAIRTRACARRSAAP